MAETFTVYVSNATSASGRATFPSVRGAVPMLPDAAVAVSEGVPRSWAGSGRLSAASSARPERAPSVGQSAEFRALWDKHEVGVRPRHVKRFVHPEAGALELNCQTLLDPEPSHRLVVYTAAPGSESHDRLRLLAVIGPQAMR